MKFIRPVLALIIILSGIIFMPSVYANWVYSSKASVRYSGNMLSEILFNEIEWVLPEDAELGQSHKDILGSIVTGSDGLNTPGSLINNAIQDRLDEGKETIGSSQVVSGGNLKKYFVTAASTEVDFVIEILADDIYWFYTYLDSDLGSSEGKEIQVFRTILNKVDGVWTPVGAAEGTALTKWYDSNKGKKTMSIDVETWSKKEGTY